MSSKQLFQERWSDLSNPQTTAEERAGNYIMLTSHLKDPSIGPEFQQALCSSRRKFTDLVLRDITCKSCDHAALQVLGYCLYIPAFSEKFTSDMVKSVVNGIIGIVQDPETSKSVCTRALWCLANQRLNLNSHVTSIVTMVTEVVTSQQYATPTVDSEALNVLIRMNEQCSDKFVALSHIWYKAILTLFFYGSPKLHTKALSFAVSMEVHLIDNQSLIGWLIRELKLSVISKMLTQLSRRGQDNCHVLEAWGHVITVLGTSLHKHGSFLNELLRVVETGFKHKSIAVQECAYKSWKYLISNYAKNIDIITSPKRLKLLLMPLVASAARDKYEQVEKARIDAYWHLIGCLGNKKEALFKQVCVPFLLLCLGLDPKSDVTNAMSRFHSNTTAINSITSTPRGTPTVYNISDDVMETPKGIPHSLTTLAVTPTPLRGAESAKGPAENEECPIPEGVKPKRSTGSMDTDEQTQYKVGSILSLVQSTQVKTKHSDHYLGEPSVTMVMTGCHAFLQFIGVKAEVSESLVKSELDRYTIFPKFLIPLELADFFVLVLDSILSHTQLFTTPGMTVTLETVVHHLFSLLICCIDSEQGPSQRQSPGTATAVRTVNILVQLVQSGCLDNVLCKQMKCDVLRQLCSVPTQLLVANGNGGWKILLNILLGYCKSEQLSDWFSSTFHNILKVLTTKLANSDPLTNLMYLLNRLDGLGKEGVATEQHLSFMWLLTVRAFGSYVLETSQINHGTTLEPDFSIVGLILKFPFLYLIPNGTKPVVTEVMDQWMTTFDLSNRHASLLVKDPNACIHLVCKELYSAYGVNVKNDVQKNISTKFDLFQNTMATALWLLSTKLSWKSLSTTETRVQRSSNHGYSGTCLQTILSLLSWQLMTVSDAVKSPLLLCQLTTPPVLMEIVALLYHHLPTAALIVSATDVIAQPLATFWENVFLGDASTLTKSRQKQQNELLDHLTNTWKAILSSIQSRCSGCYDNHTLACLSPLLVVTLSNQRPALTDLTLTFWKLTFDRSSLPLTYSSKLTEMFTQYLRGTNSMRLDLPGFSRHTLWSSQPDPSVTSIEDSGPSVLTPPRPIPHHHSSMSPSRHGNMSPHLYGDMSPGTIVHPMTSPRKGVRGSFMNRTAPTSPFKAHQHSPLSPAAKALDKVLARSAESTRSHDQEGGVSSTKGLSARRKLSLNKQDDEMYVSVDPPVKKRRLLTEHQKEKMREKTSLPAMYNALDATQDSNLPLSETQSVPVEDDPVITHESPPFPKLISTTNQSADSAHSSSDVDFNPSVPVANKEVNSLVSTTSTEEPASNMSNQPLPIVTTSIVTPAPSPQVTLPLTTTTTEHVQNPSRKSLSTRKRKQRLVEKRDFTHTEVKTNKKVRKKINNLSRGKFANKEPHSIDDRLVGLLVASSPQCLKDTNQSVTVSKRVNVRSNSLVMSTSASSEEIDTKKKVGASKNEQALLPISSPDGEHLLVGAKNLLRSLEIINKRLSASSPPSQLRVLLKSNSVDSSNADKTFTTNKVEGAGKSSKNEATTEATPTLKMAASEDSESAPKNSDITKDKKTSENNRVESRQVDPVEVENDEKKNEQALDKNEKKLSNVEQSTLQQLQRDIQSAVDVEDPLGGVVRSKEKRSIADKDIPRTDDVLLSTPTNRKVTEDGCHANPTSILRHVSQFDSPSTSKNVHRVQFARDTTVHVTEKTEEVYKTPKQSRSPRTPKGAFSSRRTLLMSQTPPRMINVTKTPQTPPPGSHDPVYPSLSGCPSPIEQILPSLTASKFTHGLVQLVRARNINTVGNISSLSEQQVQTLPIKSPKVVNLRNALRSFEQILGSKRRTSSVDNDPSLLPPPTKVARLNSDPGSTSEPSVSSTKGIPRASEVTKSESESSSLDNVFDDSNIFPGTPTASLDLSTPDSQVNECSNPIGSDTTPKCSEDVQVTEKNTTTEDLDITQDLDEIGIDGVSCITDSTSHETPDITEVTGTPVDTDTAVEVTGAPVDTDTAVEVTGARVDTDTAVEVTDAPVDTNTAVEVTGARVDTDTAVEVTGAPVDTNTAVGVTGARVDTDTAVEVTDAPVDTNTAVEVTGARVDTNTAVGVTGARVDTDTAVEVTGAPVDTNTAVKVTGAPVDTDTAVGVTGARVDTDTAVEVTGAPVDTNTAVKVTGAPVDTNTDVEVTGARGDTNTAMVVTGARVDTDTAVEVTGARVDTDTAVEVTDDLVDTNTAMEVTGDYVDTNTAVEVTGAPVDTNTAMEVTDDPVDTNTAMEVTGAPVDTNTAVEVTGDLVDTNTAVDVTDAPVDTNTAVEVTGDHVDTDTAVEVTGDHVDTHVNFDNAETVQESIQSHKHVAELECNEVWTSNSCVVPSNLINNPALQDHLYCSQEMSSTSADSSIKEDISDEVSVKNQDINKRDGSISEPTDQLVSVEATSSIDNVTTANRDMLSLSTLDHTYCKVGVVSGSHGDVGEHHLESSESQELFSCHSAELEQSEAPMIVASSEDINTNVELEQSLTSKQTTTVCKQSTTTSDIPKQTQTITGKQDDGCKHASPDETTGKQTTSNETTGKQTTSNETTGKQATSKETTDKQTSCKQTISKKITGKQTCKRTPSKKLTGKLEVTLELLNDQSTVKSSESAAVKIHPQVFFNLLRNPDTKQLPDGRASCTDSPSRSEPQKSNNKKTAQSDPQTSKTKPAQSDPQMSKTKPVQSDSLTKQSAQSGPLTKQSAQTGPLTRESAQSDPLTKESVQSDPLTKESAQSDPLTKESAQSDPLASNTEQQTCGNPVTSNTAQLVQSDPLFPTVTEDHSLMSDSDWDHLSVLLDRGLGQWDSLSERRRIELVWKVRKFSHQLTDFCLPRNS